MHEPPRHRAAASASAPGVTTTFVLFDPIPGKRVTRRRFVGLEDALRVEPRYGDYRQTVEALRANGMA
jgi:hypothetical protein